MQTALKAFILFAAADWLAVLGIRYIAAGSYLAIPLGVILSILGILSIRTVVRPGWQAIVGGVLGTTVGYLVALRWPFIQ